MLIVLKKGNGYLNVNTKPTLVALENLRHFLNIYMSVKGQVKSTLVSVIRQLLICSLSTNSMTRVCSVLILHQLDFFGLFKHWSQGAFLSPVRVFRSKILPVQYQYILKHTSTGYLISSFTYTCVRQPYWASNRILGSKLIRANFWALRQSRHS